MFFTHTPVGFFLLVLHPFNYNVPFFQVPNLALYSVHRTKLDGNGINSALWAPENRQLRDGRNVTTAFLRLHRPLVTVVICVRGPRRQDRATAAPAPDTHQLRTISAESHRQ